MNQELCTDKVHYSKFIGRCNYFRCKFEICSNCIQDHKLHENQVQIYPNYPNEINQQNANPINNQQFQLENSINQALTNFDQQFEKSLNNVLDQIQIEKQNMRIQFQQFLRRDTSSIQQLQSGPILAINQFFDCISQNINKPCQNNSQIDIDFTPYFDNFGIPDFMRNQLKKFIFNNQQYENFSSSILVQEDRPKSLIVGQKDENGKFTGRALIIYKTEPSALYFGYVKDNMRHGRGILILNGFQYYLGEYHENKEWGYGEIQFFNQNNQNEKFVGYFSEGKRCGQGQSKLLDTTNNKEINIIQVNYFNEILHGPRIQQMNPTSQSYFFELIQYEKDYFSFKDQYSDKAPLRNIQVSTKGITESQFLNKSPELQIDNSFKEDQLGYPEQQQFNSQNYGAISPQNNLYQQFNQQQYPPNFMPPNYIPPNYIPPNYMPPNYIPPNYMPPINNQQQVPIQISFPNNNACKSQIQTLLFDKIKQN